MHISRNSFEVTLSLVAAYALLRVVHEPALEVLLSSILFLVSTIVVVQFEGKGLWSDALKALLARRFDLLWIAVPTLAVVYLAATKGYRGATQLLADAMLAFFVFWAFSAVRSRIAGSRP